jgi:carbon storage regulator
MLVLSRQIDETIMIGDDIEVTVVDIRGDKVRLGISAPKAVAVHRKEVYEAIRKENKAASQIKPEDISKLPKSGPGPRPPGGPNPKDPHTGDGTRFVEVRAPIKLDPNQIKGPTVVDPPKSDGTSPPTT